MSDQENIRVVKEDYAAFGRGDIESILSSLAPTVEWVLPGPSRIPTAGRFKGIIAVAEWFETLAATEETLEFAPKQFFAGGDMVVVLGHYRARVKSTGLVTDFDWVHVFTMKDGKVTKWEEFYDTALVAPNYSTPERSETGVV